MIIIFTHFITHYLWYDFTINWSFITILVNIILFCLANWLIPKRLLKERKLNKLMDFQYEIKKYLYNLQCQISPPPLQSNGKWIKVWFPNMKEFTDNVRNIIMGKCNGITAGLIPTYSEWIDMTPIQQDAWNLALEFNKLTEQMRKSCEEKTPKKQEQVDCEHLRVMIDSLLSKIKKLKIK